jgi:hypothetical protein
MYADPSLIRDRVVKLSFNDDEFALVDALVNYTGEQKAAFLRKLILEQARLVLAGEADYGPRHGADEGLQLAMQLA